MNAPTPLHFLQLAQDEEQNTPGDQQDCQNCTRQGLAILPVRYALLPEVRGATLPVGFTVDGPALAPAVASYGLRVLRQGYLYVYIETKTRSGAAEKRWDCYGVSPGGRLRGPLAPAEVPGQTAEWSCGRTDGGSHATKASYITLPDAELITAVYFLFSQDPLSDETRAELAANTARMQKIDVPAWLKGPLPPATGAFGVDQLKTQVLEYLESPLGAPQAPLQVPFESRAAEADTTPLAMTAAMKGKYAGRAMVLALHDRIGMVQEALHARNYFEGRLGGLDTNNLRELFVSSAIENLRLDFEKRGKTADWTSKYASAYAQADVDAFKARYLALRKPLQSKRDAYSKIWCDWMADAQKAKLIHALDNRYHALSSMDCVNQTRTLADLLNGTGLLSAEAVLWQRWMASSTVHKDNLLDRAVSGGHASLLAFLTTRKDAAGGNVVDAFKTLFSAVDAWEADNARHAEYLRKVALGLETPGLDAREWAIRRGEPLLEGLQKFYQTMAGNVSRMAAGAAKHIRHAVVAGILYFSTRFRPVTQSMTAAELAMDLREVRWGAPLANLPRVIESTPTSRIYQINTTEFLDVVAVDARRFTVTQFHIAETRTESGLWIPAGNRSQGGIILPEGFVPTPAAAAAPAVAMAARPNGFLVAKEWMSQRLKGGGIALGFNAIVLFFQMRAIDDAKEVRRDPKASDQAKSDAELAIWGARIGAGGALLEGSAAAWQLVMRPAAGTLAANAAKIVAGSGGILGAASSAIAAWQAWTTGSSAGDAGDSDTQFFLKTASVVFAVSAAAGAAGALASMGVAGGVLLGLGPFGWAVIAVGAIVIGIAAMFGASTTKDDPLEAWLKQCLYGTAPKRLAQAAEVDAFNKIFELPLDAKLVFETRSIGPRFRVNASVTIPRLQGRTQRYEIEMGFATVDGSGSLTSRILGTISGIEDAQKALAPNQTLEQLKELERRQVELSSERLLFAEDWSIDAGPGRYELTREVAFNGRFVDGAMQPYLLSATLSVKYWPDHLRDPNLVLPAGGGPGGTPVALTIPR